MLPDSTGTVRRRLPVQHTQYRVRIPAAMTRGSLCLGFPDHQCSAAGTSPPNPTTLKAFGDTLCRRRRSSFSRDPGHGLVYITDRAPQGPLLYVPLESLIHFTLKHPRNKVCRCSNARLCRAVTPVLFSCHPPFRCFLLSEDRFRINFPNVFKHLYKSPDPAAVGFSCRATRRHRGSLHLGLGVAFLGVCVCEFSQGWLQVQCAAIMLALPAAASYPPP